MTRDPGADIQPLSPDLCHRSINEDLQINKRVVDRPIFIESAHELVPPCGTGPPEGLQCCRLEFAQECPRTRRHSPSTRSVTRWFPDRLSQVRIPPQHIFQVHFKEIIVPYRCHYGGVLQLRPCFRAIESYVPRTDVVLV